MNKKHGILITPATHLVTDVSAYVWSAYEIRKKLKIAHEFVYREIATTGDTIVLDAFLNFLPAGKASRRDAFEMLGETYYGNALIIPGEESHSRPEISPEAIGRCISFSSVESASAGTSRYLAAAV